MKILSELNNIRLDSYLKERDIGISRNNIQRLIENGNILVNDNISKASYKLKVGDTIEIQKKEPVETGIHAQEIDIDIIYEDDNIIVVNKEKGMVVHPGAGNPDNTLVNAVLAKCKGSLSGIGGELRPGIVHRLDKDTSGIIIIAKSDIAHQNLTEQISKRTIKKTYLALVRGVIKENEGTINMPIGRSTKDRLKMEVSKNGRDAITHFKVIHRYIDYTYLEINIETGRTHQIRVHLSKIGYPVVGDNTYSNGKNPFGIKGQMLHAYRLEFIHPITGIEMKLEAPVPEYFEEVLKQLQ